MYIEILLFSQNVHINITIFNIDICLRRDLKKTSNTTKPQKTKSVQPMQDIGVCKDRRVWPIVLKTCNCNNFKKTNTCL